VLDEMIEMVLCNRGGVKAALWRSRLRPEPRSRVKMHAVAAALEFADANVYRVEAAAREREREP
jgi:hypothetical protein